MNMYSIVMWLLIGSLVLSFLLTGMLRRYALSKQMLDIPNERSSHTVPTPRGGGLSIVVVLLMSYPVFVSLGYVSTNVGIALAGSGLLVSIVGWLDDNGHIAVRWRLLAHFVAAVWFLIFIGETPKIEWFGIMVDLGWLGFVLSAVYLVWLLNLYNFMDGIDGIAGVEAITTALGGLILISTFGIGDMQYVLLVVLAGAAGGFLIWNFPPAKVFMGDAASGFLGFTLAAMSIQFGIVQHELFWVWVILLGVFIVDATTTLIFRVSRGLKFYEAHRGHAYQFASRRLGSHLAVTLSVGFLNIFWLLPVAMTVLLGWMNGIVGVVVAYVPLVAISIFFKSGDREVQQA